MKLSERRLRRLRLQLADLEYERDKWGWGDRPSDADWRARRIERLERRIDRIVGTPEGTKE